MHALSIKVARWFGRIEHPDLRMTAHAKANRPNSELGPYLRVQRGPIPDTPFTDNALSMATGPGGPRRSCLDRPRGHGVGDRFLTRLLKDFARG